MLIEKERLSANWQRDTNTKKIKSHDDLEKKRQPVKKRYDCKKKSIKQFKKEKYVENQI